MIKEERSVVIGRPIGEVFAYVADPRHPRAGKLDSRKCER
jgi:hypothetical protein